MVLLILSLIELNLLDTVDTMPLILLVRFDFMLLKADTALSFAALVNDDTLSLTELNLLETVEATPETVLLTLLFSVEKAEAALSLAELKAVVVLLLTVSHAGR